MTVHYPRVSVLLGGDVPEHDLSIYSFEYLYGELQRLSAATPFELAAVYYLTRDHQAVITAIDLARPADFYLAADASTKVSVGAAFCAMQQAGDFVFSLVDSGARFPGVANTLRIPGNFGSILGSALALNKFHLGELVRGRYAGIDVPRTASVSCQERLEGALAPFDGEDLVVKPNALGSSVLVERFAGSPGARMRLPDHVARILDYDDLALVQQFVDGREFTSYCLEGTAGTDVLAVKQIITPDNFYGMKEKYSSDASVQYRFVDDVEMQLPEMQRIAWFSAKLAADIGLQHASRFDFIVGGPIPSVFFLEVNTNPTLKAYVEALARLRGGATVLDLIGVLMDNEQRRPQKEGAFQMKVAPGNSPAG